MTRQICPENKMAEFFKIFILLNTEIASVVSDVVVKCALNDEATWHSIQPM